MSNESISDVAILAPIPRRHLDSGKIVCDREGVVAFGSENTMLFAEILAELEGASCPVLIYASETPVPGPPRVSWLAEFHTVLSAGGRYDHIRPDTTRTDSRWSIWWEVGGLTALGPDEMMTISSLRSKKTNKLFSKDFVPHGPHLVSNPL
jgi:hypothetical protein